MEVRVAFLRARGDTDRLWHGQRAANEPCLSAGGRPFFPSGWEGNFSQGPGQVRGISGFVEHLACHRVGSWPVEDGADSSTLTMEDGG